MLQMHFNLEECWKDFIYVSNQVNSMLLPPALSYPTRPSRHQMSMNIYQVDLLPTASSQNPSSSQSRMPPPYGLHSFTPLFCMENGLTIDFQIPS